MYQFLNKKILRSVPWSECYMTCRHGQQLTPFGIWAPSFLLPRTHDNIHAYMFVSLCECQKKLNCSIHSWPRSRLADGHGQHYNRTQWIWLDHQNLSRHQFCQYAKVATKNALAIWQQVATAMWCRSVRRGWARGWRQVGVTTMCLWAGNFLYKHTR